jgi:hypothetical protein
MRWVGHAAHMDKIRNSYKSLDNSPPGKRLLGQTSYKWEDNKKIDLKETGDKGHVVGSCQYRNEHSCSI